MIVTVFVVVMTACSSGAAERDERNLFVPSGGGESALSVVVSDLVCQLDRQTLSATAVGRIENQTAAELVNITPVVVWFDGQNEIVAASSADNIPQLGVGDSSLFSASSFLQDGTDTCGVEVRSIETLVLTGELKAGAFFTSELAK